MKSISLKIDEAVIQQARQYAEERGTTLEALLVEHLAALAGRAGRRLTLSEQIYVDYQPSKAVVEALRKETPDRQGSR